MVSVKFLFSMILVLSELSICPDIVILKTNIHKIFIKILFILLITFPKIHVINSFFTSFQYHFF